MLRKLGIDPQYYARLERGDDPKRKLSEGDNFYIVPLCRKCNHYTNGEKMRIDHTIKATVLIWTDKNGSYSIQ